ncbi:DUF2511 domain-containing protein [Streptomyces sp. NPDC002540]
MLLLAGGVIGWAVRGGDGEASSGKPGQLKVSRADYADWPFAVDTGMLSCRPDRIVTFSTGGDEYALNEMAISEGYPRPGAGVLVPGSAVQPMLKVGLRLC